MIATMILIALGSPQAPAPVYLGCELIQGDKKVAVDIALDEAGQRATITMPATTRTVNLPAIFSPSKVQVADGPQFWTVSREDLSVHRSFNWMPADNPGESGTCKLAPVPAKRAF